MIVLDLTYMPHSREEVILLWSLQSRQAFPMVSLPCVKEPVGLLLPHRGETLEEMAVQFAAAHRWKDHLPSCIIAGAFWPGEGAGG